MRMLVAFFAIEGCRNCCCSLLLESCDIGSLAIVVVVVAVVVVVVVVVFVVGQRGINQCSIRVMDACFVESSIVHFGILVSYCF